jgi:hypothetical protein
MVRSLSGPVFLMPGVNCKAFGVAEFIGSSEKSFLNVVQLTIVQIFFVVQVLFIFFSKARTRALYI